MKKLLLKVGISLSVLLLCNMWTNDAIAATSSKTESIIISSDYTWVSGNVKAYYNTSTYAISSANVNLSYKFPAATIKEQGITSLKTYSATGKITATVGSITKTKTATVYTK